MAKLQEPENTMGRSQLISLFTVLFLTSTVATSLAVPTKLAQQGRMLGGAGTPLSGTHTLLFSMYSDETAGDELWSVERSVDFDNGYYSLVLGEQVPIDDLIFADGPVWLELTIDGAVISPRQELVSVPLALRASSAEHLDGGVVDAAEVHVGNNLVIDSSGLWVGPPPTVEWLDVTGVPVDLADGDADSLAALNCGDGQVLQWNTATSSWACHTPGYFPDSDGDGVVDSVDCEPNNPTISQLQPEVCDSLDNNCNGLVDENTAVDAPTWHGDGDGDGSAGSLVIRVACVQPAGFFSVPTDCDDSDPDSFTGASELCDGSDNDCNGLSDYTTTDGDGGGEIDQDGDGALDCNDCNDTDPNVFPNSSNEICDGTDNNCSGVVDEGFDLDGDGITVCGPDGVTGTADDDCDDTVFGSTQSGSTATCPAVACKSILDQGLSTGSGTYWLDPEQDGADVFQVWCEMDRSGGGWALVGRVPAAGCWFSYDTSSPDTGFSTSYGTYQPDPTSGEHFLRRRDDLSGDGQVMFAWGDWSKWVYGLESDFFGEHYSNSCRTFMTSSDDPGGGCYNWYNRSSHPEDPWIGVGHHTANILWAENGHCADSSDKQIHGGATFWAR